MQEDRPVKSGQAELGWTSDVIAEMLRRLGFRYISLNPGASYRGLHDSLVNYLGNREPRIIICLHEEHAVALAHGYAKATGEPMAVAVHANVGLMHAMMAIYNAWCDRVPVFILGATGPVDASKRRPWIDWIHTARDQGAMVRDYLKFDDQPASAEAIIESSLRALQMAMTDPKGPTYLVLDKALQETPLAAAPALPDPARFRAGVPAAPPKAAIDVAAALLANASSPLIMMGRVSRQREDWDRRIVLAETLRAKVLGSLVWGAQFPTGHELSAAPPFYFPSPAAVEAIRQADVILSLDWGDLAGTLKFAYRGEPVSAKVINCSVDVYAHHGASAESFGLPPVDVPVLCPPDAAVEPLIEAYWAKTGQDSVLPSAPALQVHRAAPLARANSGPITNADLGHAILAAVEGVKTSFIRLPVGWPDDGYVFDDPLDFLGVDGGAGIGSGPGIAVGAALGLKGTGRLAIAVIGDGDYLMGVNALWTAARYEIPLLMVVANNRSYYNDEEHQGHVAHARSRPPENKWIGQRIDEPAPDLAALARGQGLSGEGPVSDLTDLDAAIERGIRSAENGKPYVIDVLVDEVGAETQVIKG